LSSLICPEFWKSLGKAEAFAETTEKNRNYEKRNTIYIASLPKNATRETVIKACTQYGKLNCCVVISRSPKVSCGFAAFVKRDAYRRALRNGLNLGAPTITRVLASKTNVNPDGEDDDED
jgi:16S rRNA U1498 N3-methylase RsmE